MNRRTLQCFKAARWVLLSTLLVGRLLSLVVEALGASGTFATTNPVMLTNGDVLNANDAQFYVLGTGSWAATGALPTVAGPPTTAVLLGNVKLNRALRTLAEKMAELKGGLPAANIA